MAARMKAIINQTDGLTEEFVGAEVGVSQGQVSHWTNARLPVPANRAIKLAAVLNITDPSEISVAYRDLAEKMASNPGADEPMRPDLIIARLENDVDSLRYALGSLVTAMVVHRPTEAADVAEALRKHVPAKFQRQGYVYELLKVLDKVHLAKAARAQNALPSAKR